MPHPASMLCLERRRRRRSPGDRQMRFIRTYGRVIGLLERDLRIAGFLAFANLMVAGLQFLDPVLFGRVVNLLSRSDQIGRDQLWHQGGVLLAIWVGVGIGGIM